MLKTLRIASIFTVITAIIVVMAVGFLGLKGNPDIEAFLQEEGIVNQFRKRAANVPAKSDAISPLELAAKAFVLRIDPPPPPPPPKPITPPKPQEKPPVPVAQPARQPENRQPVMSAKFDLVATARYPSRPQKSMALFKNLQNEYTWYRQGENVAHFEIQEIKDGSVVLYQNGKFNSELFMPAPPKVKSLLKSEAGTTPSASQGPSTVSVTPTEEPVESGEVVVTTSTSTSPAARPVPKRTIPSRLSVYDRESRASAPSTSLQSVRSAPQQTPEEQKRSIDESISSIQEIMNRTPMEGQSQEELKQEQEAWQQLIKVLQEERKNMEQAREDASGTSAEPAPEEEKQASEDKSSDKIR